MNILRNAGTHKILRITENPLQLIEEAGRTAYQSRDKVTDDSAHKFVKMIIKKGHESVLEHASMTVEFNNVSRGFTHELVRHRLCSFTQESTRYVDESDFNVVVPPGCNGSAGDFTMAMCACENAYRTMRKYGWAAQDARQILPIAIKSQIVCTTNFRQWRHIFKLRTAKNAHWEIRRVLTGLLWHVQELIPIVFDSISPKFSEQEAKDWGWICQHCENTPKNRPLYNYGDGYWICSDCYEEQSQSAYTRH